MEEKEYVKAIYNQIAKAYEEKRRDPHKGAWNQYLEMPAMESLLKPLVKGLKVLDVGCGTGRLTEKIRDWGGKVMGVDPSEKMIEIARERSCDVEYRMGEASHLPFPDGAFDVVASSLVMHYLNDLVPAFKEVGRVLKPQGYFVFSMHHPFEESIERNGNGIPTVRPYFHSEPYYWEMCGAKLLSFHHTLENIMKSLKSAGFLLEDLVEAKPDKNLIGVFRDYDFPSKYPTFCVFKAVKSSSR